MNCASIDKGGYSVNNLKNSPFKLKTLTPIWTGNIDRDSISIAETGFLGSMRWWYEGIVRGMNGYACDPTEDDAVKRCKFDQDAYKNAISNGKNVDEALKEGLKDVCAVCRLFGCTGLAKRFRIEISGLKTLPLFFVTHQGVYATNGNWLFRIFGGQELGGQKKGRGMETEFIFRNSTLWSSDPFDISFLSIHGDEEKNLHILYYLLWVISSLGALGAKSQNGFGQVKVLNGLNNEIVESGKRYVKEEIQRSKKKENNEEHFNLNNFFSIKYEIKDPAPYEGIGRIVGRSPSNFDYRSFFIPCAFDIRYKSSARNPFTGRGKDFGMRSFFKERLNPKITSDLFGRVGNSKSASKIHVSHLFKEAPNEKYYLKVWGYVPKTVGVDLKTVTTLLDEFIVDKKGMFPGSKKIFEYNPKSVIG